MRKNVRRKDFYMEIKKSPGRFLSILFIVALGVAFFAGIRATEPSMMLTGDAYLDESNLMDIKALSTFGVTEDDVKAIASVDGVKDALGSYSADFLHVTEDEQRVLHVMAMSEGFNDVEVSEGRLPKRAGECLVDNDSGYRIGDKIKLESGTDEEVLDKLKIEELEVVGRGSSSCYIALDRGSSNIGSGSVSAFLIVPEETFDMEVFTEVYIHVEGAKELTAFTDEYEKKVDSVLEKIEDVSNERASIRKQEIVAAATEELNEAKQELEDGKQELEEELADARIQIADAEKLIVSGKKEIQNGKKEIENAKNTLYSKQKEIDEGYKEYEAGVKELEAGREVFNQNFNAFQQQVPGGNVSLAGTSEEISSLKKQIAADKEAYENLLLVIGQKEEVGEDVSVEKAQAELLKEKIAYEETVLVFSESKLQLDESEKILQQIPAQLIFGQEQIDSGWLELEKQEKKLKEGEAILRSNELKLADAKREYEEGKVQAEAEIAEAEEEITEAEKDISEIEEPKWYVYDRSTLTEYTGFGENAERIGAIGKVFPWFFFLVAALISLTSMTRMVEEQRVVIGTMKALGYGKFAVASKYIGYAMLATVGGSVFGVLVGEKIIPYVIIYAYSILYRHLPAILTPYEWKFALTASVTAVVFILAATVMACYKALDAQPAKLMRPPSPKHGKRVFLEKITPVWKRLSFTWKATVRNLIRYKKRFFMTIFGIGGCMALLLVGFGLRDSIYDIADIQYEEIQIYDGSIYLQTDLTEKEREELDQFLKKDRDLQRYVNTNMQNVTLINGKKERDVYECVYADDREIEKYVHFRDRKTQERYNLTDAGVIISEKTGKLLNAEVGDTIFIKDEENGNKEVVISAICENYMGHYMYMTPAYYELVYGYKPEYNSIFFEMKDSYGKSEMEDAGQDIMKREEVLNITYMHDIEKSLENMLGSLNLVMWVLIICAGLLAFVVLYNLNTINITERQRELATLKVLGFYDKEVAAYVYRENIILTLFGGIAGAGLGKVLHQYIIQTVEVDSAMFGRIINPPSYVYSLLLTVLFSLLINGVMYFKLKKIDMVESLKSIE